MEKNRNAVALAAAGLILVAVCCVCSAGTVLGVFDRAGGAVDWVARLFRQRPEEMTLDWVLRNDAEANFQIGPDCEYSDVQGSAVSSGLEAGGGSGFARDLSREEVTALAAATLQGVTLQTRDGSLALASSTPVEASLLSEEQVSISFTDTSYSGTGPATRSLNGVVTGNQFQGRFSLDGVVSTVVNGQGVEEAVIASTGWPARCRSEAVLG
jgi:hypothetical protein